MLKTNDDFLDDYVAMASLSGNSFAIDTVQVHTFLVNLLLATKLQGQKSKASKDQMMGAKPSSAL